MRKQKSTIKNKKKGRMVRETEDKEKKKEGKRRSKGEEGKIRG